jgi:hypothetical protein
MAWKGATAAEWFAPYSVLRKPSSKDQISPKSLCRSSADGSATGHTVTWIGTSMVVLAPAPVTTLSRNVLVVDALGSLIVSHNGVVSPRRSAVPTASSGNNGSERHPPPLGEYRVVVDAFT